MLINDMGTVNVGDESIESLDTHDRKTNKARWGN